MKPALLLCALLSFSACSFTGKEEAVNPMEAPKDLIAEETFVRLVYEMNLLEGARTGRTLLGDSLPLGHYYQTLYRDFGVSAEQVQRSFAYYHGDAERMARYYQWIIDSLRADVQVLSTPTSMPDDE